MNKIDYFELNIDGYGRKDALRGKFSTIEIAKEQLQKSSHFLKIATQGIRDNLYVQKQLSPDTHIKYGVPLETKIVNCVVLVRDPEYFHDIVWEFKVIAQLVKTINIPEIKIEGKPYQAPKIQEVDVPGNSIIKYFYTTPLLKMTLLMDGIPTAYGDME